MSLRSNWRVILLVLFVLASSVALFIPGGLGGADDGAAGADDAVDQGPTNLKYGLDLSGGTRIRAPVVGMTAEDVDVSFDQRTQVERTVADELGVTVTDVTVRPQAGTVEVFSENVSREEFAAALQAANVQATPEDIREGVTEQTRNTMVDVIQSKVSEAGLSGGTVQQATTANNEHFIVVEMPNANRSQVQGLLADRGVVEVQAQFPAENGSGYRNETVLEQGDFSYIGPAETGQGGEGPYVPVTLRDEPAQEYQQAMVDYGFADEGVDNCQRAPPGQKYCLNTVVDGEVVYSASMGERLAQSFRDGTFVNDPGFRMITTNMSEARELQIHLLAGALPAPLDLDDQGTSTFLSPSIAQEFKLYSLLTGLAAVLAVSGTVFVRYRDPKVALPMLVTALTEVLILLGFAAAIELALDLSHIAGFIAVIGTGVDDLVIIADEVMAEGDVRSDRVFRSRFRKAFWVIGAAAATTIIAMSPLAVLSLGDLRGFAIVTILGVLVGVLVTRPAYGDILRALMTRY